MRYVLLLVAASFFWGGNFVIGKGLTDYAAPETLTIYRYAIAVLCLLPIVWWKEKRILPDKKALLPLFCMGVTGVVLFNILQFLALANTSASNVGVISTLNTLSIAVCAALFLKERINRWQIGAMILSFSGAMLVITKGTALTAASVQPGDIWMVAAVMVFGLYSVFSRWATKTTSPMMSVLYSGVFGIALLLPFHADNLYIAEADGYFFGAMMYISLVATILCMVFWGTGVKHLGATASGLFMNLNPVFTVLLAFLLLGERLTWSQGIGTLIVIAGCLGYSYFRVNRWEPQQALVPEKH
ncbi:DMT family transporter [Alkalicoccus daliensis]|uniref:Permease of the drug/metabolite transporter (DMT) superfamily n=1 Tax=Alkalicoccus daliensis TaxID=745820 RepID=A0A1H0EPY6_9BACI|nr:DMT family transporter [Alkalicoccus daliensis]SDN84396.1 Permease of the drug/metabolite transporter (DMT) superfamily [Alkalicoccus daliensis]